MFASTNELRGTSYKSRIEDPKYQFAGKTGTAQVKRITERDRELDLKTIDIPYNERDHALYVAFGPYKNPRYALKYCHRAWRFWKLCSSTNCKETF